GIPKFDRVVGTACGKPLAVRRKGYCANTGCMALKGQQFATARHFPYPGQRIAAAGNHAPAIRGKCQTPNFIVVTECSQFLSGGGIPNLSRLVEAAGGNQAAIWREGCRPNPHLVPLQSQNFLTRRDIPDLYGRVLTGSCHPLAIRRESN